MVILSSPDGHAGDQAMTPVPCRALVVSATIGEGHNSAGRALAEAIGRAWPGCEVRWLDTLASMGPGMGPLARASYVTQVQHAPWLYEFFFSAMWGHRWLLQSTRRGIGSWCGRGMASDIRAFDPDVIISTYPLGSAGLSWLRQHRRLATPVGAWVPAFCPHPYWLYRNLDVTFVSHPAAVPVAAQAEPGVRVAVGALPVRDAFAPADRGPARARLGIGGGRFVALVSAGSFGFGGVDRAVTAMLAAGPQIQVIAICGRNERLRARLAGRGEPAGRLRVIGWTDDMPGWLTASDVVVTNAGGATALEALASERPLIMFEPIAGHGRANAALMTSAGLALTASSPAALTAAVRRLASDQAALAGLESRLAQGRRRRREDDLAKLAAMPGQAPPPPFPVAAQDALFLHVQTERRPQQVGAVVVLAGPDVDLAGLRCSVAARAAQIPQLRRRLLPAHSPWVRARWLTEDAIDVHAAIKEVTLGADGAPASLDELVGRYFAEALDPGETPWQLLLVHDGSGASSAIVVKIHHALGDGYELISALSGLLDTEHRRPPRPGPRSPAAWRAAIVTAPRHATRIVGGLLGMALAGPARQISINGAATDQRREFATLTLDSRTVAVTARRLGASVTELVLALVAEALGRLMAEPGQPADGQTVRAMVPSTLRVARHGRPGRRTSRPIAETAMDGARPGNRTTGILLDLPTGPMPLAERVAAIRAVRQARLQRGDADASAFVLHSMMWMPPPLQRAFARASFTSKRFNLIVSVFPGMRRTHHLLGTDVTAVFPVLALASGVGLAVGAMTWGQSLAVGLTADPALVPDASLLAAEMQAAFTAHVVSAV
jgi:diacylglycerol O-acyltransferase / wax synthase